MNIKKMQTGCPKMHRGKGTIACVRVCATSRVRLRSVNSTRSRIRVSCCSSAGETSVIQMCKYKVRNRMILSLVSVLLLTKYEMSLMIVHTDGSAYRRKCIQNPVSKMNILTFSVLITYNNMSPCSLKKKTKSRPPFDLDLVIHFLHI